MCLLNCLSSVDLDLTIIVSIIFREVPLSVKRVKLAVSTGSGEVKSSPEASNHVRKVEC